ncbi:MAG: hypothetical protein J6C96_08565 [Oscillospiraceae bacterium]|nr:hypothetical protein [Oscillospiraceae bacterium]
MSKKVISKIAALGLAGASALSVMSLSASAALTVGSDGKISGDIWSATVATGTPGVTQTKYYSTKEGAQAAAAAGTTPTQITSITNIFPAGTTINIAADAEITKVAAGTAGSYITTGASTGSGSSTGDTYYVPYKYASTTNYRYLASNGKYYPNSASVYNLGLALVQTELIPVDCRWTSEKTYFDAVTGTYGKLADMSTAGGYAYIPYTSSNYDYYYDDYYYYDKYDVYKVGSYYYPTLSDALAAAGHDYSKLTKVSDYSKPASNYFSNVTGRYYASYEAALAASNGVSSRVTTFSGYSTTVDAYDPYYYYFLNGYYYGYPYGTTTYKVEDGDATLHNNSKKGGWSYLAKYLENVKAGSSVSIDMNDQTSVPKDILSAIKGRNVDIVLYMDNGAVFTINGKDVSSAAKTSLGVKYNTDYIPSKLVKAAYKKNKAVSSAQLSLNGDSFGFEADVTVKFSAKRAGYVAKLYRYNSSKNTLSLVDSSTIKDNGKCTFNNVTKGGDYVVVIC